MAGLSIADAAKRSGVEPSFVEKVYQAGILHRSDAGLTEADVRRLGLIRTLEQRGIPLEPMAVGLDKGLLSFGFVDGPEYERFATLSPQTFRQVSDRTDIPLSLLLFLREVLGAGSADPDDLMRSDELRVVPFLEAQCRLGFDKIAIERLLRAMGDSTRRIAEAEAEWWRSQVTNPRLAAGERGDAVTLSDQSAGLSAASQEALLAIYNAQQAQTWTSNITAGFEYLLAEAGIYEPPNREPAICFLDITGYTRLTQERGDTAAAELAETLARIVKRTSGKHGGRPVKWLGDGVMFHFPEPARGVAAALDMVDALLSAGLPPAHVGLHAGPVVVQEGDYYGQTVNMASRIAEYARPGEVLVSQAIADASAKTAGFEVSQIGDVELKGVAGATRLFVARRS